MTNLTKETIQRFAKEHGEFISAESGKTLGNALIISDTEPEYIFDAQGMIAYTQAVIEHIEEEETLTASQIGLINKQHGGGEHVGTAMGCHNVNHTIATFDSSKVPEGAKLYSAPPALEAENAALAANQCLVEGGIVGDDGGTPYCTLIEENARLRETLKTVFVKLSFQSSASALECGTIITNALKDDAAKGNTNITCTEGDKDE